MWAGASVQFEYLVYGAVLMTFGFTFGQAVLLILVGNLSYLLLGVCSLQGPEAGTTAFTINRAGFGPNGSRPIALFNWATQVGFETEGLILIVFGGIALAAKAGYHAGTPLKVVLIIVAAAAIQAILPFLGYATMVKVLRVLVIPFVALYVILAVLTIGKANPGSVHPGANWQTMMGGLAFTIALTGLGWVESGNDFSRYLPRTASRKSIVGWVFVATAIPQAALMLLGRGRGHLRADRQQGPLQQLPACVQQLVPGAVLRGRHPAVVRHQQHGSVLVGRDPPGPRPADQAMERRPPRHRHRLRHHRLRRVLGGLQPAAERLRGRCHRLDRPVDGHLPGRLAAPAPALRARSSCSGPIPAVSTGAGAECTGPPWWPRRSARRRRCWPSIRASTSGPSPGRSGRAGLTSACSRGSWWAGAVYWALAAARRAPGGAPARSSAARRQLGKRAAAERLAIIPGSTHRSDKRGRPRLAPSSHVNGPMSPARPAAHSASGGIVRAASTGPGPAQAIAGGSQARRTAVASAHPASRLRRSASPATTPAVTRSGPARRASGRRRACHHGGRRPRMPSQRPAPRRLPGRAIWR